MKQNGLFYLARLASSLSLFGILLCMHMLFTLAHFLPSGSKDAMEVVYIFYFPGIVLGAVLCPLFLPVPGGKKIPLFTPRERRDQSNDSAKRRRIPLFMSMGFIAFLIAVECTFRSLGIHVWLGSRAVRSVMAVPEGMLTTMCYGLFYLTWLRRPAVLPGTAALTAAGRRANRTSRFCSLVLGAALLGSVLARYYSVPSMEKGIAAEDPLLGAAFVHNGIIWCMIALGAAAAASVFLMRKVAVASVPETKDELPDTVVKTDWVSLLRLIGLASVFTILNAVTDMQTLPLYSDTVIYYPHYLTTAAVVPILGFFAGRGIGSFVRRFMPVAIIFFILFSCLPLFEQHPLINVIMSTLVAIGHYTAWVVFTTAVVEYYAGGFWFYGMTTAIFFSVAFAFLAPVISPLVPDGTEYRVLFTVIASVLFMLLSFRFRFPKTARQEPFHASILEASSLEDIFKEHGLSQREIEVANLLVNEGLGKQEIGERLFIAPGTAKIHISTIYQKFHVNNRAEFMALFVNRKQAALQ